MGTAMDDLKSQMEAVTAQLADVATQVTKISGETTKLIQMIEELQAALDAAGTVPPDVQEAMDKLTAQAGVVQSEVQAVDDLVPDAPPP